VAARSGRPRHDLLTSVSVLAFHQFGKWPLEDIEFLSRRKSGRVRLPALCAPSTEGRSLRNFKDRPSK